jgi:hypothetical protein
VGLAISGRVLKFLIRVSKLIIWLAYRKIK